MLLADAVYPAAAPCVAKLRHVVLTRFNMLLDPGAAQDPSAAERWAAERAVIFEEVCLPSMLGQKSRPFRWYIGVNGRRPELADPIREAVAGHPWIQVVNQQAGERFDLAFGRGIRAERWAPATHAMTTRLDCDDALAWNYTSLAERYAKAVLSRAAVHDDFWISFPVGAQLHDGKFALYIHPRSHFLTRVVPLDALLADGKTALQGVHSKLFSRGHQVYTPATTEPMWMQNVHGGNALNEAIEAPVHLEPRGRLRQMFSLESGADRAV